MAVKMRLRREGKKKQPYYRVVVADVRAPRDGAFLDDLGYYQPLHDPSTISIDRERALTWLRNGAQPTSAVVNLLRIQGIWEEFRPGDPGRDRSAKHAAKAAKAADREARAREEVDAARRQREEAEAAAAAQAAAQAAADAAPPAGEADDEAGAASADATPPVSEADEETVAQAVEEVTQPDAQPAEDAGALPPDAGAEPDAAASAETTEEEQS